LSENGRAETLIPPRAITALAFVAVCFGVADYFARMRFRQSTSGTEILISFAALALWVLLDTNEPFRAFLLARPKQLDPAPLGPANTLLWTVFYLGLILFSQMVPVAFLGADATKSFDTRLLVTLCSLCIAGIVFIVVFVLYLSRRGIDRRAAVRLRFSPIEVALTAALLLLFLPISAAAGWLSQLIHLLRGLPPATQELVDGIKRISNKYILFAFAVMAVAAVGPVLEELVFRGLVFRSLRDNFGFLFALIASSAIFAFVHPEPAFYLQQALLGAVLCVAYERTQSLTTPILIHCLNNLLTIIVTQFS